MRAQLSLEILVFRNSFGYSNKCRPSLSTAIVMFSGLVCVGRLVAFGNSPCTCE